jgi:hypothetical protein
MRRLIFLFMVAFVLSSPATLAQTPAFDESFCSILAEMADTVKAKRVGSVRMINDAFALQGVTTDCGAKKTRWDAVAADPNLDFKTEVEDILCSDEHVEEPNPYLRAVREGWDIEVNLTFPDGTKQSRKICQAVKP